MLTYSPYQWWHVFTLGVEHIFSHNRHKANLRKRDFTITIIIIIVSQTSAHSRVSDQVLFLNTWKESGCSLLGKHPGYILAAMYDKRPVKMLHAKERLHQSTKHSYTQSTVSSIMHQSHLPLKADSWQKFSTSKEWLPCVESMLASGERNQVAIASAIIRWLHPPILHAVWHNYGNRPLW